MSNYNKYKKYNLLIKKNYIKLDFISKQTIFNDLNKNIEISRLNNLKHNLDIIFFKILNLICILKLNLRKFSTVHYWIPDLNSKNFIDQRSQYFLRDEKIKTQINLVRTNSLIYSLKLLFSLPNVVFLSGFHSFNHYKHIIKNNNLKFRCEFYENNERILNENLKKFFSSQKIKRLISIDDYRIIQNLILASKLLKIKTTGYQHGRFSKFQIGLSDLTFDKFYVWSNFFKRELIKINKKYQKKHLIIKNFRFKKMSIKKDAKNILYICEENLPIEIIINDIKFLIKNFKNSRIIIRLREKQVYPKKFSFFLHKKKILISKEKTLLGAIITKKIKFLIAYSSTALLEASLYNVIPLMLVKKGYYNEEYIKQNIVFKINQLDNLKLINRSSFFDNKKKSLEKIKNKLWN